MKALHDLNVHVATVLLEKRRAVRNNPTIVRATRRLSRTVDELAAVLATTTQWVALWFKINGINDYYTFNLHISDITTSRRGEVPNFRHTHVFIKHRAFEELVWILWCKLPWRPSMETMLDQTVHELESNTSANPKTAKNHVVGRTTEDPYLGGEFPH